MMGNSQQNTNVKSNQNKDSNFKPCAIKCQQKTHRQGSLYFCSTYRQKTLKEKNALLSKLGLCRMCLQRQHIGRNGHVDHSLCHLKENKCKMCSGKHNILLCPETQDKNNLARTYFDPANEFENYTEDDFDFPDSNFYSRESFKEYDNFDDFLNYSTLGDMFNLLTTHPISSSSDSDNDSIHIHSPCSPALSDVESNTSEIDLTCHEQLESSTPSLYCYESLGSSTPSDWTEWTDGLHLDTLFDEETVPLPTLSDEFIPNVVDLYLNNVSLDDSFEEFEARSPGDVSDFQASNDVDPKLNGQQFHEKSFYGKTPQPPKQATCMTITGSDANKAIKAHKHQKKPKIVRPPSKPVKRAHGNKFYDKFLKHLGQKQNLAEKSATLNAYIKKNCLVDRSEKGNEITSYSNRNLHWKKSLLESAKYRDNIKDKLKKYKSKNFLNKESNKPYLEKTKDKKEYILDNYYKKLKADYELIAPNMGNDNYQKLASESMKLYTDLRKNHLWNNKSIFTMLQCPLPKNRVDLKILRKLNLKYHYEGNNIIVEIGAILDGGADQSHISHKLLSALDLPYLEVKMNNTTIGVTGILKGNIERVNFPIRDAMGNIHSYDFKVTKNPLGCEPKTSKLYRESCCELLGIDKSSIHNFNFLPETEPVQLLIGLNNPFVLPTEIDPRALNLNYPVSSPNLKLLQTPLSKQIIIAGSLGLCPELFTQTQPIFFKPRIQTAIEQQKIFGFENFQKAPVTNDSEDSLPVDQLDNLHFQTNTIEEITPPDFFIEEIKPPDKSKKPFKRIILKKRKNTFETKTPQKVLRAYPVSFSKKGVLQDKIFLCREDHNNINKFIEAENNTYISLKRKCLKHAVFCQDCNFVNRFESAEEENLSVQTYNLQKAIPLKNGTFKLVQQTLWLNDPHISFHPKNSNIRSAAASARGILTKLSKKDPNLLLVLEKQIQENLKSKFMTILTPKQVEDLKTQTHSFCNWNVVWNEKSTSTPIRLVCNSSTVVAKASTTISIEQCRPRKPLNSMFSALIRMRLFPVLLLGDLKKHIKT